MKTRDLTRCAMMCGVFGVLLVINQQTAFMLQVNFPFVFAFPAFFAVLKSKVKSGIYAAAAMFLMMFMFGSILAWLTISAYVAGGLIFGICYKKHYPAVYAFLFSFICAFLVNWSSLTVFSALFGYSVLEDQELFAYISPFISYNGFLFLTALLMGAMESLTLWLMCLLIVFRYAPDCRPTKFRGFAQIPWIFGYTWILLILLYTGNLSVLECPVVLKDILFIVFIFNSLLLVYSGMVFFLGRIRKPVFYKTFAVTFGAAVPIVNFAYMAAGLGVCVKNSMHKRIKI